MIDRNVYSSSEAYDLMYQGDIFTDGELYYYCGTTNRKDGISIRIIQVYDSLIEKVDPIAFVYPQKWIDETRNTLWKAYMTSGDALKAMDAGHAVMDSNGYIYFESSITNPATNFGWSRIYLLEDIHGDPQKSFTREEFKETYKDDNYFIIYNTEMDDIKNDRMGR